MTIRHGLLAGALCLAACGEADTGGGDYETTEVADGVYRFRWIGHNSLFVVTEGGVIAFDPISVEAARVYAEEIRAHAGDVGLAAIVYSHRDADHATGAAALRAALESDAPIYAHANALGPLVQTADPDLPPPDATFDDRMELAGGEVELRYLGRSHSDDMAVAYLPGQRIAFAVDFVSADRLGYRDLATFYFPDMHDAISRLLDIPFETIVFGHGPSGDRGTVERQARYYRDLEAAVRRSIQEGLSEDETAARVLLDDYRGWDRYDDWRELNVRGMYRALTTD